MRNNIAQTTAITANPKKERAGGLVMRGFIGTAAIAALVVAMGGSASAAPGQIDDGPTEASVEVSSAIALTGLTPSFTLTGLPGATVTGTGAVTFNVATNNLAGYAVTVQSQTATMTPGTVGNTDSIPVGALSVRQTGDITFEALSNTEALSVRNQGARSLEAGDDISNDYQVQIPFVNEDTYSATLDYIATTL